MPLIIRLRRTDKWVLITSLGDFSRKILYADFFQDETTWAHISSAETLMLSYGIPLRSYAVRNGRYYVDSLRIFRFVQGRDSLCGKTVEKARTADR